jgi:hypothetical protein
VPCKITHGHARQALQGIRIRPDPPKVIAHPPILVEHASRPECPHDSYYGAKADHESKDDQHDVEIISWNFAGQPRQAESHERTRFCSSFARLITGSLMPLLW